MPANRRKMIILVSLLLSWSFACNSGGLNTVTREHIRTLSIVFDESQRREFFNRLRAFAKEHDFEFEIVMMDADGSIYSATLLRGANMHDNIVVFVEELTLDHKVSPRPTMIYFEGQDQAIPVDTETKETVDTLVSDLLNLISDIPTIKISEEK